MLRTTPCWILAAALAAHGLPCVAAGSAPMRDAFVTTQSGLRIHTLETGPSASPRAVVLLPAWRVPAFLWQEQLRALASTTRAVAIDVRSQGESTSDAYKELPIE